jgi:hypothetical protein
VGEKENKKLKFITNILTLILLYKIIVFTVHFFKNLCIIEIPIIILILIYCIMALCTITDNLDDLEIKRKFIENND